MLGVLGDVVLWSLLLVEIFVVLLGFVRVGGVLRGGGIFFLQREMSVVALVLCVVSFLVLLWGFVGTDLSLWLVWRHSHEGEPLLYRVAGVWGNHEGSLLLWLMMLCFVRVVWSFVGGGGGSLEGKRYVLGIMGSVILSFVLLSSVFSSPFRGVKSVLEGSGLNPILQDPSLAFHPPFFYLGAALLLVPFSVGLLGCFRGVEVVRGLGGWLRGAFGFLTIAIALGSYWAYYELGWGGWWFWDPVETVALMPWLLVIGVLHLYAVGGGFGVLLMSLLGFPFLSVLMGMFLVRSGVLVSVHGFASSPTRGVILLMIFLVFFAVSVVSVVMGPGLRRWRREVMSVRVLVLLGQCLWICAIAVVVLMGTLWPVISGVFFSLPVALGEEYFTMLLLPMGVFLVMMPVVSSRGFVGRERVKPLLWGLVVSLGLTYLFWRWQGGGFLVLFWVAVSFWGIIGSLWEGRGLVLTVRSFAHVGVCVSLLGIASQGLEVTKQEILEVGEHIEVAGITLKMVEERWEEGENYQSLVTTFEGESAGKPPFKLSPSLRYYKAPLAQTWESDFVRVFPSHVHMAINTRGAGREGLRYLVQVSYKPLIDLIWLGALVMGGSVLVSVFRRGRRKGLGV